MTTTPPILPTLTNRFALGTAAIVTASALLVAQQPSGQATAQDPNAPAGRAGGRGLMAAPLAVNFDDRTGFTQIFDGKTMSGWEGATEVWRVVDGAIVAENTPEKPVGGTTFVFYKDTEISDFELKVEMKVEGGGNSGIQYRSRNVEPSADFGRGRGGPGGPGAPGNVPAAGATPGGGPAPAAPAPPPAAAATAPAAASDPNADPCAPGARGGGGRGPLGGPYSKWNLQGYQFDTDPNGCMSGQLFEGGRFVGERGITTRPGQVVLLREGQPNTLLATVAIPEELRSAFKRGDWNQYHVVARGYTFMHILNGKLASVTIDDDVSKRQAKGVVGIQIEGPRKVSFRNVWLKKL